MSDEDQKWKVGPFVRWQIVVAGSSLLAWVAYVTTNWEKFSKDKNVRETLEQWGWWEVTVKFAGAISALILLWLFVLAIIAAVQWIRATRRKPIPAASIPQHLASGTEKAGVVAAFIPESLRAGFIGAEISNSTREEQRIKAVKLIVRHVSGEIEELEIQSLKRCEDLPHIMPPRSSFEVRFKGSVNGMISFNWGQSRNPARKIEEYFVRVDPEVGEPVKSETRLLQTIEERLAEMERRIRDAIADFDEQPAIPVQNRDDRRRRRIEVIMNLLREEFILLSSDCDPAIKTGDEHPPYDWINKRLRELGETWHCEEAEPSLKKRIAKLLNELFPFLAEWKGRAPNNRSDLTHLFRSRDDESLHEALERDSEERRSYDEKMALAFAHRFAGRMKVLASELASHDLKSAKLDDLLRDSFGRFHWTIQESAEELQSLSERLPLPKPISTPPQSIPYKAALEPGPRL